MRDCPYPRKERPIGPTANQTPPPMLPPLTRFCGDCGIKHFVPDCPKNPDNKNKGPAAVLNLIELLPSTGSPSTSDSEIIVPLKAITRAQARTKDDSKRDDEAEPNPSEHSKKSKESWKARRARRAASRRKQNEKINEETTKNDEQSDNKMSSSENNQQKEKEKETKNKGKQSAGSVLAEKHYEPLDALLQAYEARLKKFETLEERWKNYPNASHETRQLEISKRLIEAAQAIEQQLKGNSPKETQTDNRVGKREEMELSTKPEEEKVEILEEENKIEPEMASTEQGSLKVQGTQTDIEKETILIPNTSIPEVEEEWGKQLWEAVKKIQQTEGEGVVLSRHSMSWILIRKLSS